MPNAIDISTSGLVAQRLRLNIIANNIANVSTTRGVDNKLDANGDPIPYVRKRVIFKVGMPNSMGLPKDKIGVHVHRIEDDGPDELGNDPFRFRYEPGHPDANAQGYVRYPNVDLMREYVDGLVASRAYEANIQAIELSKSMGRNVSRLLE